MRAVTRRGLKMSKVFPVVFLGLSLAAGGAMAKPQWTCPHGTFPDKAQALPNCASRTPLDEQADTRSSHKVLWSCPEGSWPDKTAAMPNCHSNLSPDAQARAQREAQAQAAREQAKRDAEVKARQEAEALIAFEKRVEFAPGSAELGQSSKDTLDEVAQNVQSDPTLGQVLIKGHADSTGPDALNEKLSAERAQVVKDYLSEKGVPSDKLETKALGENEPVASNESVDGRALNRSAAIIAVKMKATRG